MSRRKRFIFLLSPILISFGIIAHPAYADTFNEYQSAAFLAKIPEVKVETGLIATHAGNKDAINYYVSLLNRYWTANDTKELYQRDPQLAGLLSSAINDTIVKARAGDYHGAFTDYFNISGYMEQAGVVRVDPDKLNNSTIQAMSITMVVKESIERYGDAISSPQLEKVSAYLDNTPYPGGLADTGKPTIVNGYAYENSKDLAHEALDMFGQLITHKYEPAYSDKINSLMTKYVSDLNSAEDPNVLMSDVFTGIYPNFEAGYGVNLESIPEFAIPLLATATMISIAIAITRIGLRKISSKFVF